MKLSEIAWPVSKLGDKSPSREEGVTFYVKQLKDGVEIRIVDDLSIEGDTVGKRRTKLIVQSGVKLHKINTLYFFLGDFIKDHKPGMWYIDAKGRSFTYTKEKMVPLVYRKIVGIRRMREGTTIEVEGIEHRFKCLFAPSEHHQYAGLLKINPASYLLYDFSDIQHKDTVRKI